MSALIRDAGPRRTRELQAATILAALCAGDVLCLGSTALSAGEVGFCGEGEIGEQVSGFDLTLGKRAYRVLVIEREA